MSKNNNNVNFLENINQLYGANTYLEKNGMSIIITTIIFIVIFSIITYSEISSHLTSIKQDWTNQRCHPKYMPLAGFINAPEGTSKWEYTAKNFQYCISSTLGGISSFTFNPLNIITTLTQDGVGAITGIIEQLGGFISIIRNDVIKFAKDVIARILNLFIPIIRIWHKIADVMNRTQGVMGFIVYFVDMIFFTIIAWINSVVKFITYWILYIFEMMGITGLALLIPLVLLFGFLMVSLYLVVTTGTAAAIFPFVIPVFLAALISLTAEVIALSVAMVLVAIAIIAIILVIELFLAFVWGPTQEFVHLMPGLIHVPLNKNYKAIADTANTMNLIGDFVKPQKLLTTKEVKEKKS